MNTTSFPVALFWAPGGTTINLGSFAQGQGFVFCGTVTSGSGVGHMNGVQVGSNTNPSTSGSSQNYFGSGNGDGGYLTIDIAEIIIYTGVVSSIDRQSIENYLSAKWAVPLSRSGVTLHPFNSIRPFLRRFNPIDISGCSLWLDAADTRSMTFSGSNITQWNDKSGNNNNVVRITTGPTLSTLNSLSSVYIDTAGAMSNQTIIIPTTYSVFSVINRLSGTGYQYIAKFHLAEDSYFAYAILDGNFATFAGNGVASTRWWDTNANTSLVSIGGSPILTEAINNGSVISPFTSGTSQNTKTGTTLQATGIAIGSDRLGGQTLNGNIGEFLLFTRVLTTSERQQIEGYLAYKWGLTSPLPATHPFKKLSPSSALPFSPTGILDCGLWFDAADISTIIGTSQVTAWRNKGSILVTATNRTGSCTSGNTLSNGLNFIRCPAGTDLGFTCALTSQARTWFIVARNLTQLNATFANAWGPINQTTAGGQDATVFYRQSESLYRAYIGAGGIAVNLEGNFQSNPLNQINMYCFVNSTNTALNTMTLNGTALSLNVSLAAASYKTTSVLYTINTTGYNTGGDYFEILFYTRALSSQERQQIEGYLAEKWGLKSSLPSTHLYRSFPPAFTLFTGSSTATGGTVVSAGGFTYHVFTSSGNFTVTASGTVNYLFVGGGGGGGDRHGGGGGAGGVVTGTFSVSQTTYTVTVGAGGIAGNYESNNSTPRGAGIKGGDTTISGWNTANGGGGGGTYDGNPTGTVGSGGGGGGNSLPGVAGTAGQGNAGGAGSSSGPGGGGGGGAGGAGVAANTSTGGIGTTAHSATLLAVGYGTTFAIATSPNTVISGGVAYIAGGGGGASGSSPGPGGSGGLGGGGRGDWDDSFISAGTPNTGGGGGGSRSNNVGTTGRDGGSGLVIIWY
jgi:hypothetical protein